eukprot:c18276_g2_i1 orf=1389-2786(+)
MDICEIVAILIMLLSSLLNSSNVCAGENNNGELWQQEQDRIVKLPGQPKVSFSQYSGYVTIDETAETALFYWLTEAAHDPLLKPLILWLNGGPGCSSIAYGASEEIGPFHISKNGTSLSLNPFSWNKVANLLFLESPAGVGFSYTSTISNSKGFGDYRTAEDSYVFLVRWFKRFPQYIFRDFYLCGESYAGHYVPQLAKLIHDRNKGLSRPSINLKGFMVGNAVMDNIHDNLGYIDFMWTHAMISNQLHQSVLGTCDFAAVNTSASCNALLNTIEKEIGSVDPYNIYSDSCADPIGNRQLFRFKNWPLKRMAGYDPCVENNAELYYNKPNVQTAFHANKTSIPYPWTACSSTIIHNWKDSADSVLPIYRELLLLGLRIWVYSGDVDSVVPVTATRYSLAQLKLPIKVKWYPWYHKQQVGGWTEIYEGLTFVTVRGAGHEVPRFQPARAFTLVKSFLAGMPLPKKN